MIVFLHLSSFMLIIYSRICSHLVTFEHVAVSLFYFSLSLSLSTALIPALFTSPALWWLLHLYISSIFYYIRKCCSFFQHSYSTCRISPLIFHSPNFIPLALPLTGSVVTPYPFTFSSTIHSILHLSASFPTPIIVNSTSPLSTCISTLSSHLTSRFPSSQFLMTLFYLSSLSLTLLNYLTFLLFTFSST